MCVGVWVFATIILGNFINCNKEIKKNRYIKNRLSQTITINLVVNLYLRPLIDSLM